MSVEDAKKTSSDQLSSLVIDIVELLFTGVDPLHVEASDRHDEEQERHRIHRVQFPFRGHIHFRLVYYPSIISRFGSAT